MLNDGVAAQPEQAPPDAAVQRTLPWRSLLVLIGTLLLTIALVLVPGDLVARLGVYGYLGVFLLTLLSSATLR